MKIYTRKGDMGETSLLGGERVKKDHYRIEAYGTIDELNSWLGLLADETGDSKVSGWLQTIQHELFSIGSHLALSSAAKNVKLPALQKDMPQFLEEKIDEMEKDLPPLKNFILPGGHPLISKTHIARCICRRAERAAVALHSSEPIEELILTILNRLSDFLFMLARRLAADLKVPERVWNPRQ